MAHYISLIEQVCLLYHPFICEVKSVEKRGNSHYLPRRVPLKPLSCHEKRGHVWELDHPKSFHGGEELESAEFLLEVVRHEGKETKEPRPFL